MPVQKRVLRLVEFHKKIKILVKLNKFWYSLLMKHVDLSTSVITFFDDPLKALSMKKIFEYSRTPLKKLSSIKDWTNL